MATLQTYLHIIYNLVGIFLNCMKIEIICFGLSFQTLHSHRTFLAIK